MATVSLTPRFKCIKYSLFVFCIFSWILGLITLITGVVTRVTGSFGPLDAHIPAVHSGANILIAVGIFIILMGILGCCGAIRENQCLLIGFFLSVFFCFTLLMAAGLWAVAWSYKVGDYMYRCLEKLVVGYDEGDKTNESTQLLDFIQQKLSCCGANSAADYGRKPVPKSCGSAVALHSKIRGCYEAMVETCNANLSLICGIGIAFGLIMVAGMVCTMMMCCALREVS